MSANAVAAIVYAAKSTADDHGSIPTQLADGRALAERHGLTVVEEHSDEAASAYSGNRGSGLAAAMADCKRLAAERGSCELIVQHSDRLARGDGVKARHLVELLWWAQEHGVTLRSVQDDSTFSNPLLTFAMGERNTEDSRRKVANVKAGMRRRASERGKLVGGPRPYGYRWVPEIDAKGKKVSHLEIVPTEAPVVVRIYEDTCNGASQMQIAKALTADGIPTATGRRGWAQPSVRRVLVNPLYRGAVTITGDEFPGEHEPLVSVELWERARLMREAAARTKGHGGGEWPKGSHLMPRGLLRCGLCGSALIPRTDPNRRVAPQETYFCDGRRRWGTGYCPQLRIDRATVDGAMLAELQRRYVDFDETRDRLAAKMALDLNLATETLAQAERAALDAEANYNRVRGHYREGRIEPEVWAEERPELQAGMEAARAAVEQARDHAARVAERGPALDAEAEMFRRVADLRAAVVDGVRDAAGLNGLRRLLRHMFEEVRYMPVEAWQERPDYVWPEVLADFDGQAYLAPILSERVFEGIDDASVPPRIRRGVLPLESDSLSLQT